MKERNATLTAANIVCTIIFCAFTFLYLFFFQNDLLAYAQHNLSNGLTSYNSTAGAITITVALVVLSVTLSLTLLKNFSFLPAVFHLPSAFLLAMICDVHIIETDLGDLFGNMWIYGIAVTAFLLIVNICLKNAKVKYKTPQQAFFINLLVLFFILLLAVFTANTNEEDHESLRCERYIINKEYDKAIEWINRHNVNTPETAMMKAFAMAKTGRMGETFFENNVMNGSASLFPLDDNMLLMMPPTEIYKTIGGIPAKGMSGRQCLEILYDRGVITPVGRDYLYISCLLDRDIDAFVKYYSQDRDTTAADPKHYAEALAIYHYEHESAAFERQNEKAEAGFADFLATRNDEPNKVLRENGIRDLYGNTYWFYYFFTSSNAFTQSVSNEN